MLIIHCLLSGAYAVHALPTMCLYRVHHLQMLYACCTREWALDYRHGCAADHHGRSNMGFYFICLPLRELQDPAQI